MKNVAALRPFTGKNKNKEIYKSGWEGVGGLLFLKFSLDKLFN